MKPITHPALLAATLLSVAAPTPASAAEAETGVIDAGSVQLEFKLGQVRNDRDSQLSLRERATPFLARIGIGQDTELRLETDGRVKASATERATGLKTSTSGWADASVGLRWRSHAGDDKTGAPAVAWQLGFGLPTGSSVFKGDGVSTALKLAGEWNLGDDMTIGVMPGLLHERNADSRRYTAPSLAITLGKGWTPEFRTTVELVAPRLASAENGGTEATFNLGATYALTESFEFEAVYLRGITKNTPETSIVFGLNVKF